jgi:catechol 2,3-dioxygenase-like lactoylglutathione lyase family enzyme
MPCPPINGVVESILYADDLPRAVAFYTDIMGLRPIAGDSMRFRAFDSGKGRVLILFKRGGTLQPTQVTGGVIPPHDGRGPHHIAFAISADDYESWRKHLALSGIAIESETHWTKGGRSLYFRDLDNHLVELVTPGIWSVY